MNNLLTAKILTANFTVLNDEYDYRGDCIAKSGDITTSYKVYEFSNGLILVPCDTTNDWFFDSRDNIEGCASDEFLNVEDTEETIEFTTNDLFESYQGSVTEFDIDINSDPCNDLIQELLVNALKSESKIK